MTGIDRPINLLRNSFENLLWKQVSKKEFHGRIYRNDKRGVIIPEVHKEGTNEYQEVLFNDKLNALCFFDPVGNINNLGEVPTQEVRIVFSVNLKGLYPNIQYRATEKAHADVLNVIKRYGEMTFELLRIETGLNAYGDLSTDKLKHYSMHPFYAFAIIVNIPFSYNCQL